MQKKLIRNKNSYSKILGVSLLAFVMLFAAASAIVAFTPNVEADDQQNEPFMCSPITFFEDDFESGEISTLRWTTTDSPGIDSNSRIQGTYCVVFNGGPDPDDAITSVPIDVTDYENVRVWYTFNTTGLLEDFDYLYLEYSTDGGATWQLPPSLGEWTGDYDTQTVGTGGLPGVSDTANLQIRFRIVSADPEFCFAFIDDIFVTARPIDCGEPIMLPILETENEYYNTAPTFSQFRFEDYKYENYEMGPYYPDGNLDYAECKIDSQPFWRTIFSGIDSPTYEDDGFPFPDFEELSEGYHTIYFRVGDDYGNTNGEGNPDTYSWSFYKDTIGPDQSVEFGDPKETYHGTVEDYDVVGPNTPIYIISDDGCGVGSKELHYYVQWGPSFEQCPYTSIPPQVVYDNDQTGNPLTTDTDMTPGRIVVEVTVDESCWHQVHYYCIDDLDNRMPVVGENWTDFICDADVPIYGIDYVVEYEGPHDTAPDGWIWMGNCTKKWINVTDIGCGDYYTAGISHVEWYIMNVTGQSYTPWLNGIVDDWDGTTPDPGDGRCVDQNPADGEISFWINVPGDCRHYICWRIWDDLGNYDIDLGIQTPNKEKNMVDVTYPESELDFDGNVCQEGPDEFCVKEDTIIEILTENVGQEPCIYDDYWTSFRIYVESEDQWYPDENGDGIYDTYGINAEKFYWDGLWWYVYDQSFQFTEQCNHTLVFFAKDALCNTEPYHVIEFHVDDQAPHIDKDIIGKQCTRPDEFGYDDVWCISTDTDIRINAWDLGCCDNLTEVTFRWQNITTGIWHGPYDALPAILDHGYYGLRFSNECEHALEITAKDCLGNTAYDIEKFYVDAQAPYINKTVHGPQCIKPRTSEIPDDTFPFQTTFYDGEPITILPMYDVFCVKKETDIKIQAWDLGCCDNLTEVKYRVWEDGLWGQWVDITEQMRNHITITYNFDSECEHWIQVYAKDCLGHESWDLEKFLVDETIPEIHKKIVGPQCNEGWVDGLHTMCIKRETDIKIDAEDKGCCNWLTSLNFSYQNVSTGEWFGPFEIIGEELPYIFNFPEQCEHILVINATDCLGNTNQSIQRYYVDDTPPAYVKLVGEPKRNHIGRHYLDEGDYLVDVDTEISIIEGRYLTKLELNVLDGIADDSFDLYIDDILVHSYTNGEPINDPETWYIHSIPLEEYLIPCCGTHTIKIVSTGEVWEDQPQYGQLAVDYVELWCNYELCDHVDIGDTCSESDNNLVGWGPVEPGTNGGTGSYGGIDDCRTVFEPAGDTHATLEITCPCVEECCDSETTIEYRIWNETHGWTRWKLYEGPFTFNEECKHFLEIRAYDCLENGYNSIHNETFYVDDNKPYSWKTIYGPTYPAYGEDLENEMFNLDTQEKIETFWLRDHHSYINISAEDLEYPCMVGLDYINITLEISPDGQGQSWETLWMKDIHDYYYNFTIEEDCLHRITWYAVDLFGNTEDTHVQYHRVDSTPPESEKTIEGRTYPETLTLKHVDFEDFTYIEGWDLYNELDDGHGIIVGDSNPYYSVYLDDDEGNSYIELSGNSNLTMTVSSIGLHNVKLLFDLATVGQVVDTFRVYYRENIMMTGEIQDWILLEEYNDEQEWNTEIFELLGMDDTIIDIKFEITNEGTQQLARLDNIKVTAEFLWTSCENSFTITTEDMLDPCAVGVDYIEITKIHSCRPIIMPVFINDFDVSQYPGEETIKIYDNKTGDEDDTPGIIKHTFSLDEECYWLLIWRAVDKLGNEEKVHFQYHKVDCTPPHLIILKPSDGWYSDGETIPATVLAFDIMNPHSPCLMGYDDVQPRIVTDPMYPDNIITGFTHCAVGIEDGEQGYAWLVDITPDFLNIVELETENFLYDADAHEFIGGLKIPHNSGLSDGVVLLVVGAEDRVGNNWTSMHEFLLWAFHEALTECIDMGNPCLDCIMDFFVEEISDFIADQNIVFIGIDNTAPEVEIIEPIKMQDLGLGPFYIDVEITDSLTGILTGEPVYISLGGIHIGTLAYDSEIGGCEGWLDIPPNVPFGEQELNVSVADEAGTFGYDDVTVIVGKRPGPVSTAVDVQPDPSMIYEDGSGETLTITGQSQSMFNFTIAEAEYFISNSMPTENMYGTGTPLSAKDGSFDESLEELIAQFNTDGWNPGKYTVWVHAKDIYGAWGTFDEEEFNLVDETQWRPITVHIEDPDFMEIFNVECGQRYIRVVIDAFRPAYYNGYEHLPKDYALDVTVRLDTPYGAPDQYYKALFNDGDIEDPYYHQWTADIPVYMYSNNSQLDLEVKAEDQFWNKEYDDTSFMVLTTVEFDQWMEQEWNSLTLPYEVIRCSSDVEKVLASINNGNFDIVWYYDPADTMHPWKSWSYQRYLLGWEQSLPEIIEGEEYWVHISGEPMRFYTDGTEPTLEILNPYMENYCIDDIPECFQLYTCEVETWVTDVMLQFQNLTNNSYWNGTGWQNEETWFNANSGGYDIMSGGGYWEYCQEITYKKGCDYELTAYAIDASGCESIEDTIMFHIYNPDMMIEKQANGVDDLTISRGEPFTFSIYIENTGDLEITETQIIDLLPANFSEVLDPRISINDGEYTPFMYDDVQWDDENQEFIVTWILDQTLNPGDYAVLVFNTTILNCGEYETNTAMAYGTTICETLYDDDTADVMGVCNCIEFKGCVDGSDYITVYEGLLSIYHESYDPIGSCEEGDGEGDGEIIDVCLLHANGIINAQDVKAKISSFGDITVTLFDVSDDTPSLSYLENFDAVFAYSNEWYDDKVALGNVLADYADQGGGVVLGVFSWYGGFRLDGRYMTESYGAIQFGNYDPYTSGTLGTIYEPSHPIMQGVSSFSTGNFRAGTSALNPGATLVAEYTDGQVLVAVNDTSGTYRTCDLGFFPPSEESNSGSWHTSTDGALLMRNALRWVAGAGTEYGGNCGQFPEYCGTISIDGEFYNIELPEGETQYLIDGFPFLPLSITNLDTYIKVDGRGDVTWANPYTIKVDDTQDSHGDLYTILLCGEPFSCDPALMLTKDVWRPDMGWDFYTEAEKDDIVRFNITIENPEGSCYFVDGLIEDELPDGLEYVDDSTNVTYIWEEEGIYEHEYGDLYDPVITDMTGYKLLSWSPDEEGGQGQFFLPPGAVVYLEFEALVTGECDDFENMAYAEGYYTCCEYVSDCDTAEVWVGCPCEPDVDINKQVRLLCDGEGCDWYNEVWAEKDDIVEFNITVYNDVECCDFYDITVIDVLPCGLEYVDQCYTPSVYLNDIELDKDVDYTIELCNYDFDVWFNMTDTFESTYGGLTFDDQINIYFFAEVVSCELDMVNTALVGGYCDGEYDEDNDTAIVNCGEICEPEFELTKYIWDQEAWNDDQGDADQNNHAQFKLSLVNTGDCPIIDLSMNDGLYCLPYSQLRYVSGSSNIDYTNAPSLSLDTFEEDPVTHYVFWNFTGQLDPGEIVEITFEAEYIGSMPIPEYETNWAYASAKSETSGDLYHSDSDDADVYYQDESCIPSYTVEKASYYWYYEKWDYAYAWARDPDNYARFKILFNVTGDCPIDGEIYIKDILPENLTFDGSYNVNYPTGLTLTDSFFLPDTHSMYFNFTGIMNPDETIEIVFNASYIGCTGIEYYELNTVEVTTNIPGSSMVNDDVKTYYNMWGPNEIIETLSANKDAYVDQANPNTQYGSLTNLQVGRCGSSPEGDDFQSLITFDISTIPVGSTINSATLRIYAYSSTDPYVYCYRILTLWSESVTYNSMPGHYPTQTDVQTVSAGWNEWDVTSDVNNFINGPYNNHGWKLRCPWSETHCSQFYSREGSTTPELVINYTPPSP